MSVVFIVIQVWLGLKLPDLIKIGINKKTRSSRPCTTRGLHAAFYFLIRKFRDTAIIYIRRSYISLKSLLLIVRRNKKIETAHYPFKMQESLTYITFNKIQAAIQNAAFFSCTINSQQMTLHKIRAFCFLYKLLLQTKRIYVIGITT